MNRFLKNLELTKGQTRFVLVLSVMAIILSGSWLIAAYSAPSFGSSQLPVIISDSDREFTGIFIVDPNSSPADSLELLPGIGPVIAERIVSYRKNHKFETEVDITEVYGIGPKLYEKIKPYLKIKRNN